MLDNLYYGLGSLAAYATTRRPVGRSIYAADWDICIVLDSCRADTLRQRWPPGIDATIDTAWSRGSISTEWLSQTFRPERRGEIADTTLVTANPHTATVFDDDHILTNQSDVAVPFPASPAVDRDAFEAVYELWRTRATVHDAVPPDVMADATLEAYDRHGGRVVAHWLQPHEPFIAPDAPLLGGAATSRNVWDGVMAGDIDAAAVIESYECTLDLALFELADLCQRVDATVLVTADHGNAFGEWGVWGHPFAWPQPAVRRVPWVTVDTDKSRAFKYQSVLGESGVSATVDSQLAALGYR